MSRGGGSRVIPKVSGCCTDVGASGGASGRNADWRRFWGTTSAASGSLRPRGRIVETLMLTSDILSFASGSIRGHRLRSSLTIVGIAVGIGAVVVLTAIGEGVRQFVLGESSPSLGRTSSR